MATFQQPPPPYSSVQLQSMQLQPMTHPAPVFVVPQTQTQQPQAMTVNVIAGPHGNCRHCRAGNVVQKRDNFWLALLMVLAVMTFPFGLFFCCFIPFCTWERVCTNCRRRS